MQLLCLTLMLSHFCHLAQTRNSISLPPPPSPDHQPSPSISLPPPSPPPLHHLPLPVHQHDAPGTTRRIRKGRNPNYTPVPGGDSISMRKLRRGSYSKNSSLRKALASTVHGGESGTPQRSSSHLLLQLRNCFLPPPGPASLRKQRSSPSDLTFGVLSSLVSHIPNYLQIPNHLTDSPLVSHAEIERSNDREI